MDKVIEESNILSKLIEITDIKIFIAERELKLRERLQELRNERKDNNAQA